MTFSPRLQIVAAGCACAAASAYLFAVDPADGGYPQCLLYRATGLYCAGCGATRALHALLHGRVLQALHDNVLFLSLLPLGLAVAIPFLVRVWAANRWPQLMLTERAVLRTGLTGVGVMMTFMVLRNLPGPAFDFLRPLPLG